MSNKISARIIADSKSPSGARLTTFILTYPRIIHSEMMTHRAFSRNSASSRAIPFKRMVKMVKEDPFIPLAWQKDHSGMQGTEYFDSGDAEVLTEQWLFARDQAVKYASSLNGYDTDPEYGSGSGGVTKQLCNRLLEPFLWHTALVTATDFENFFALRAHPDAEIHIQDLAEKMLVVYNESIPKVLMAGDWHMPFGDQLDVDRVKEAMNYGWIDYQPGAVEDTMREIATARCARVSYLNFEGKDDYYADIKLFNQLIRNGHWSPTEHCAQAQDDNCYYGNLHGFKQYRKFSPDENKSDSRVIKK